MARSSVFRLLAATAVCVSSTLAVGSKSYNGLANTPPMGWVIAPLILSRPAPLTFVSFLG